MRKSYLTTYRMDNYSAKRVQLLVEGYAELREVKGVYRDSLRILVELADLDKAIRTLPPKAYQAVLLHGLLSYTLAETREMLAVSESTVSRRYYSGLQWIHNWLNGRNPEA